VLDSDVDDIQTGDLPIALAGIEGALGEYEPLGDGSGTLPEVLGNARVGAANVLDHEFVADGSTDNSTALATMLSGTQEGTEYYFPPGDYLLGPVVFSDLRHFRLHPGATIKLKDGTNTHAVKFDTGSDGSTLAGGSVDGNGANQSGGYGIAILAPGVAIDGTTVENAHSAGIYALASRGAIRRCRILDPTNYGVIVNCTGLSTFYDWDISDNYIDLSTAGAATLNVKGIGLVGQYGSSRHVYRSKIQGNTVLLPTNTTEQSQLGIEVWGGSEYSAISGNVVVGGYFGISVNHADFTAVSGNVVIAPKYIGIELAESKSCAVAGNTVSGGDFLQNGIVANTISGTYGWHAITGNTVADVTLRGIYTYNTLRCTISGNMIATSNSGCQAIVLQVSGPAYSVISGNTITGAGTAINGIVLDHTDTVSITGNHISGFATAAIRPYAATTFSFDDISVSGNSFASNGADWSPALSGGASLGSRLVLDIPSDAPTYTITNVTTDRSLDADSTTTAELADALGTLIADLRTKGIVK
jgi:nitrous oxidase accessory protein NosD